jgi:AAA+ superfamily predicted ATPase
MPTESTDAFLESVPLLFAAAQSGDVHGAMVTVRRLLERLRSFDPGLAEALKSRLPRTGPATATRRAQSSQVVDMPHPGPSSSHSVGTSQVVPAPHDRDTSAGLLRTIDSSLSMRPVMHAHEIANLDAFLHEHRQAQRLARAGLMPRSTLFLVGPPGVGKTMTAAWIARELAYPLYEVEIPALISSYLGRTGQNLREIFDFARSTTAVILLDEFDAVAKRRDDTTDLGEMRRIVSVLLKEIEEWPGPSVIVAATNHPELIDPAALRRFQTVVRVSAPGKAEAEEILRLHLEPLLPSRATMKLAAHLLESHSGSDIRDVAQESRRAVALDDRVSIEDAMLRALASRARTTADRRRYARAARALQPDMSFAMLGKWLGVSKATIHNYLMEGRRDE